MSFLFVSQFFLGVVGIVWGVSVAKREKVVPLTILAFTVIIFLFASHEAFNQGILAERTLNPHHNYIVKAKAKKRDNSGMTLLVYDMVDEKDHVVDIKKYLPNGFIEELTADRRIMLIPG